MIDWVNDVFGTLIDGQSDVGIPVPSQPDYVALHATRGAPTVGPPVAVIGRGEHAPKASADEQREAEAAEVAAAIARAIAEGWTVDDGKGGWRRARLGDITVLIPARTSLPFLQEALDGVNIPHRAESSSLVYATRAIRDLFAIVRAVDDPTDTLRLVTALRTPLLGCGDDDLFRFKVERAGRWSYLADQPATVPDDDPVLAGLRYLRGLYEERQWLSPSALLDRIVADRRVMELGFGERRPRDVWRRVRFVVDQARAWSDATAGNLREYVHWVTMQTVEGARVAEAILPETDDDAVRIMTIHAAKGLEFPITIVSGMSTLPQSRRAPAEAVFPPTGGVGYRFGKYVTTEEWAVVGADRRADELPRAQSTAVRRLHARVRPPDRVVASPRACPRARGRQTHERRTARVRDGRHAGCAARRGRGRGRGGADRGAGSSGGDPVARSMACRARRRARDVHRGS